MRNTKEARSLPAISRRLKATRLALGFRTQAAYCRDAGIEKNTYNQWERGKGRPDLDNAIILCEKFDLTLDWIYFGDLSKVPHDTAIKIEAELQRVGNPTPKGDLRPPI